MNRNTWKFPLYQHCQSDGPHYISWLRHADAPCVCINFKQFAIVSWNTNTLSCFLPASYYLFFPPQISPPTPDSLLFTFTVHNGAAYHSRLSTLSPHLYPNRHQWRKAILGSGIRLQAAEENILIIVCLTGCVSTREHGVQTLRKIIAKVASDNCSDWNRQFENLLAFFLYIFMWVCVCVIFCNKLLTLENKPIELKLHPKYPTSMTSFQLRPALSKDGCSYLSACTLCCEAQSGLWWHTFQSGHFRQHHSINICLPTHQFFCRFFQMLEVSHLFFT